MAFTHFFLQSLILSRCSNLLTIIIGLFLIVLGCLILIGSIYMFYYSPNESLKNLTDSFSIRIFFPFDKLQNNKLTICIFGIISGLIILFISIIFMSQKVSINSIGITMLYLNIFFSRRMSSSDIGCG